MKNHDTRSDGFHKNDGGMSKPNVLEWTDRGPISQVMAGGRGRVHVIVVGSANTCTMAWFTKAAHFDWICLQQCLTRESRKA